VLLLLLLLLLDVDGAAAAAATGCGGGWTCAGPLLLLLLGWLLLLSLLERAVKLRALRCLECGVAALTMVRAGLCYTTHNTKKKKKRGYRVCSSGYAATDTSTEGGGATCVEYRRLDSRRVQR
jgi:hypothetical protein